MRTSAAAVLESVHGEGVVLEEVRAEASINDLLAEVTVAQRYRNPEDSNIEAVYTFPLPLDGVLLGFEVEIAERKLTGTVVEKSDAERRYEDAITDGDAAILLEQAEPGLYTASVGNLLPGETATIRFRYGLLLRWNGDRVRFMMPTTIAPRYGDPAAAGLAPHQSPEYAFDAEQSFKLHVSVRGVLKDGRFDSPSHAITVAAKAEATTIDFVGTPAMDRDFVLEARATQPEAAGAMVAPDLDGWVMLSSFRPDIPESDQEERRGVKIVVDCSGSMGGDSIAQARMALERILDGLRPGDLFEILAFGSSQHALFGREMPVSKKTLTKARRFVRALDADMGGTEIGAVLDAAYGTRGEADLPRDLLLITDGEVWDDVIARAKTSGHRVFTVGVGSSVAEPFVRGLAEATGGACELVAPREDMAARIHRHFQRMYAPRAVKAEVHWPGKPVRSTPEPLKAVYGGDTLHLFAWFAEKPEGRVSLNVTLTDGRTVSHEAKVLPFTDGATAPKSDGAALSTLARLGAARRLAAMDDDKTAIAMAVRYQLMSQWTNYIVIHVRAAGEKAEDLPKIMKVPQLLAAGWHGTGTVVDGAVDPKINYLMDISRMVHSRRRTEFRHAQSPRLHELRTSSKDTKNISVIDLTELVALLNARTMPPFPTLDDFAVWGVSDAIMQVLRDLVDQDGDEEAVVLTFLYRLAQSDAGDALERQARRRIIKAYKTLRLDAAWASQMEDVFRQWSV